MKARLASGLDALGISPPTGATDMLATHLELVGRWNRAYNLTAVRDPAEMVTRHVLDSAAALAFLRGRRMLDAGSGAGFPGIVLALLAPETEWTLIEANGKKARFLAHALRRLGLTDRVSVAQERLENCRPAAGFDTVTARALADLAMLVGWAEPLLAADGRVVAFKGRRAEITAELAMLPSGWRVQSTTVVVPGEPAERHLVVLERDAGK